MLSISQLYFNEWCTTEYRQLNCKKTLNCFTFVFKIRLDFNSFQNEVTTILATLDWKSIPIWWDSFMAFSIWNKLDQYIFPIGSVMFPNENSHPKLIHPLCKGRNMNSSMLGSASYKHWTNAIASKYFQL